MKSILGFITFLLISNVNADTVDTNYKCYLSTNKTKMIPMTITNNTITATLDSEIKVFTIKDPGLYSYYAETAPVQNLGSRSVDTIRLDINDDQTIDIQFGVYYIDLDYYGDSYYTSGNFKCINQ